MPATAAVTSTGSGILRPEQLAQFVTTRRHPPGPAVAAWVENYWSLAWDLPGGTSFLSETLPHPACSLTLERGSHPRPEVGAELVVVTGVITRRFGVRVQGWGRVAGVKFRPGGLAALVGGQARGWTDRVVPAREVVASSVVEVLTALDAPSDGDVDAWTEPVGVALAALSTRPDARYERLLDIVADMLADHSLVTVAQVGRRHGTSVRTLQRWFIDYVGVGPKWVLARYRMHDVVTALDDGYAGSLADLAHAHGWYDQAHFTRDFVRLVGVTPGQYRERRDI